MNCRKVHCRTMHLFLKNKSVFPHHISIKTNVNIRNHMHLSQTSLMRLSFGLHYRTMHSRSITNTNTKPYSKIGMKCFSSQSTPNDSNPNKSKLSDSIPNESKIIDPKLNVSNNALSSTGTQYENIKGIYTSYANNSKHFYDDTCDFVGQLEKKNYNIKKLKYIVFTFGILLIFMFWRTIKSFIGKETSEVAIQTINSGEVQKNLYAMFHGILTDAKNDPLVAKTLGDLIQALMRDALINAKNDPHITQLLTDIVKENLQFMLKDPETMQLLQQIASNVVNSNETQNDLQQLVTKILTSSDTKNDLNKLVPSAVDTSLTRFYERVKGFFVFW